MTIQHHFASQFYFSAVMPTEPESLYAAPAPESPSPQLTILVVEDNLINQKVIVQQLQSLGYGTDLATNGQSALDATETTYYPIILMDCRLPKVDGYTATRQIRLREQQHQQPRSIIIALTASDDPRAQEEAIEAGMDDFLTKPLRRETLATVIENWYQLVRQPLPQPVAPASNRCWAQTTPLAACLDLDRLDQLSDGNWDFAQELIQLYLEDTELQMKLLQQAIDQNNCSQIEQLAHHIRGASANIGAGEIEQITAVMEQVARQEQQIPLSHLQTQIEQALEHLTNAFNAIST